MKEVVGGDAVVAGNSLGGFTALAAASHAPNSIKVGPVQATVEFEIFCEVVVDSAFAVGVFCRGC